MRAIILLLLLNASAAEAQNKPELFMPGIISNGLNNRDLTISPDGNEMYYSIQQKDFLSSTIIRLQKKNGKWGDPEVAPFSGKYRDLEACFSPDGNRIYFASDRPSSPRDTAPDFDIWYVARTARGWSEPVHCGFVVNGPGNEFYPSVARSGNLYFTSEIKDGKGREDIVMCAWKNDAYAPPVSLPEAINSKGDEYNAFIDPDEQYIIFTSPGRADGLGRADMYVSKKDADGNWSIARNLGESINSRYTDYCPYVSADKQYLYFSSNRPVIPAAAGQQHYKALQERLSSAGNGLDDVYRVRLTLPFD